MNCAWCKLQPVQDGPFCQPDCRAQYRRIAEQLGWVRPSARPRVVALRVLQTREERQADDRILRANPLPGHRHECQEAARPCPHVSCSMHLYLDVLPGGAIRFNFPGLEPWEIPETCAKDLIDQGGATLEEVGRAINLTRERVRQLIEQALRKAKRRARAEGIEMEAWWDLERPAHHLEEAGE
jgi:hypothetical protein